MERALDHKPKNSGTRKPAAPQWKPGQSGNPKGRPRGSRHRASIIAEKLIDAETRQITRKCIDLALQGDPNALRLVVERLLPPVRERRICSLRLPPITTAAEAASAMALVIQAMSSGAITPAQGESLTATISGYIKVIETVEIEARLAALEAREKVAEKRL